MKTIIAGGRDYRFTVDDWVFLDDIHFEATITEVVSGGATGADSEGEAWANKRGIPVKRFPAEWAKHGKAAGPKRNQQMAEYADAAILFPGGRGTADMLARAQEMKLSYWVRK